MICELGAVRWCAVEGKLHRREQRNLELCRLLDVIFLDIVLALQRQFVGHSDLKEVLGEELLSVDIVGEVLRDRVSIEEHGHTVACLDDLEHFLGLQLPVVVFLEQLEAEWRLLG